MPRPKGLPKTGGKKVGSRNKATAELKEIIDSEMPATDMVRVLKSVATDVQAAPAARVGAVKELWDRRYGKAPQAITGANGGPLQLVAALGTMKEDQLEELIASLGGEIDHN